MKKITIILIEDNRLLREGLLAMFERQPDMKVVQANPNDENILKIMRKQQPQVMLLDLGLRNRAV